MTDHYPDWGEEDWGDFDWPPYFVDVATIPHDADPEQVIEDLLDGEQYSVRMRTETDDATSEWTTAPEITKLIPADAVDIVETTETSVTIEWTDNSEFRGSYQIYRQRADWEYDEDDPGRLVGTVASDQTSFTDETASPNVEYEYMVRARSQWVYADSDATTTETESIGLETTAVSASAPHVEVDHADGATLGPTPHDISKTPTVNDLPTVEVTVAYDESWHSEEFDDADLRVWDDGERQPIERLVSRSIEEGSSGKRTVLKGKGGTELESRVVARTDGVEPVGEFVERLIDNETPYEPVVDAVEEAIREGVLLQEAETLAELQAALLLETLDEDETIPLELDDEGRLWPLQTCWMQTMDHFEFEAFTWQSSDSEGGDAVNMVGSGQNITLEFSPDHTIPGDEFEIAIRYRTGPDIEDVASDPPFIDVQFEGSEFDTESFANDQGWQWVRLEGGTNWNNPDIQEGDRYTINISPNRNLTENGTTDVEGLLVDAVGPLDNRYEYDFDNSPSGSNLTLDGPQHYPDAVPIRLEAINTPLAIDALTIQAESSNGEPIAELALGTDGTEDFESERHVSSFTIDYSEPSTTALGRVGVGRDPDVQRDDESPAIGYEARPLDRVSMTADLDETPVLVNRAWDDSVLDILRECVDIGDMAFEVRYGADDLEVHVSRIDGRPSDVDPDLIDASVERQTEDTYEGAVVYAGKEALRNLVFEVDDVDEWQDLPLEEGRIVEGSTTFETANGDSLTRGEDFELREIVLDGVPQFRALEGGPLAGGDEVRFDCDFQPRGEHTRVDADNEDPRTIVDNMPELASKQMADIAAFQAVEGSYSDAIIDASITVQTDQVGWRLLDALNVADLVGDRPFQVQNEDSDASQAEFRLGVGQSGEEALEQLRDRISRTEEKL
ncbi:fibronectin type III domain-containing protein [Halopiger goleimassiliensis]|uniref:fibronectin type III domain-containing protein n=1 Tax=Halopiger goleimassiliensis TaxID=1293048 RepID=UPI0006779C18|nr:fibronectin type III domain-containing protein [Halopiger goleimassiliensis]